MGVLLLFNLFACRGICKRCGNPRPRPACPRLPNHNSLRVRINPRLHRPIGLKTRDDADDRPPYTCSPLAWGGAQVRRRRGTPPNTLCTAHHAHSTTHPRFRNL